MSETPDSPSEQCSWCNYVGAPMEDYFGDLLCRLCASTRVDFLKKSSDESYFHRAVCYIGNVILEKIEGRPDRSDEE